MTTPPTGRTPAPTSDPGPSGSAEEERATQLARWSTAASVLVIGSALGTLVVTRFPQSIGLGVLALMGLAAAVYARRFRAPTAGAGPAGPVGGQGSRGAKGGSGGRAGAADAPEDRPGPTLEQRRARSTVVTIVIGSIVAALHLLPALAWNIQLDHQECLDGAVTNQGREACANELDDRLRDMLPIG
ncbi:hypothetical protein [Georgenia sp. Z1491]|uniref:hypothetical protein n=1 Tax=Georgenia sp. Z1491 TaxID=3416707 RepID=UPI003CF91C81